MAAEEEDTSLDVVSHNQNGSKLTTTLLKIESQAGSEKEPFLADCRSSILEKFDPLAFSYTIKDEQQLEKEINESKESKGQKTEPIEFELVKMETNTTKPYENGFDNLKEEALRNDGNNGSGELEVPFTLTDTDSIATENWYSLEATPDEIQKENQELKTKISELEGELENYVNRNDSHELIVADYEKEVSAMTDEAKNWKSRAMTLDRDKILLVRERDQARKDLHNVEAAFSDVHSKYERTKEVLRNNCLNQQLLESRDLEMQERLKSAHEHIAELEEEFKDKLSAIYASFEAKMKNQDIETTRLRAQLRKLQMKNETLENEVKQKSSEVAKLSSLCDELINKV